MKEVLHRIVAIGMTLLLLVSTTSWTIGKHYCKGHLVSVSLFSHTDDCSTIMAIDCDVEVTADAVSCCSNEIIVHNGQDDFSILSSDLSIDQLLFTGFASLTFMWFELHAERPAPHEHYPPPIVVENIHLLDQVFLI